MAGRWSWLVEQLCAAMGRQGPGQPSESDGYRSFEDQAVAVGRLRRLEPRIVLDAAGGPDPVSALAHDGPVDGPVNPQGAGESVSNAAHHMDASGLADDGVSVLLIDQSIDQASTLAGAIREQVIGISYDPMTVTADSLAAQIRQAVGARVVESIGLATHAADGALRIGAQTTDLTALADQQIGAFWQSLASLVGPGGRIDLLGCDIADGPTGLALIGQLESLTGVNFAASDDLTGSVAAGGDWMLETDGVDAAAVYFDGLKLAAFGSTLANTPADIAAPATQSTAQDTPVTFNSGSGNAITVSDADGGTLTITLEARNGTLDLSQTTGLSFSVGSGSGDVNMTFTGTIADINAALENMVFTPDAAYTGLAWIKASADDGIDPADWSAVPVLVSEANDAPTMTGVSVTISAFPEDQPGNGNTIGTLLDLFGANAFTDPDAADADVLRGIAVTEVDPDATKGAWEFSVDGGLNWSSMTDASNTNVYLLADLPDTLLRFNPTEHTNTTDIPGGSEPWLSFVVWDQTDGVNGQAVDPDTLDETTMPNPASFPWNFSQDPPTAVNDAPVLDTAADITFASINEDNTTSAGNTVADLVTGKISEVADDEAQFDSIAITQVDNTHGVWQYDTGGGWTDITGTTGSVVDLTTAAIVLDSAHSVRFVPDAKWFGTATIQYRAWDHADGAAAGDTVDVSADTDAAYSTAAETATLTVNEVNYAPTDIALTNADVNEHTAGASVGTLSATDPDPEHNSFTFTIQNDPTGRFEIVGTELRLASGQSLDAIATPTVNLTIRAADAGGQTYDEILTITVNDINDAPSDITLSNASVDEHTAGAVVGNLSSTDADPADMHSYVLVNDPTGKFEIVGNELHLAAGQTLDAIATPTVELTIRSDDGNGGQYNEVFTITVTDINDAPTDIALSSASVSEGVAGAVVGDLSATDADPADSHTFALQNDPTGKFEIVAGQLKLIDGQSLDAATTPTVDLTIRADDGAGGIHDQVVTVTVSANQSPPVDPGDPADPGDPGDDDPGLHDPGDPTDPGDTDPSDPGDGDPFDDGDNTDPLDTGDETTDPGETTDPADDTTDTGDQTGDDQQSSDSADANDTTGPGADAGNPADQPYRDDDELIGGSAIDEELALSVAQNLDFDEELILSDFQPEQIKQAYTGILSLYTQSSEQMIPYLNSAFRAVVEAASTYRMALEVIENARAEILAAHQAGYPIDPNLAALLEELIRMQAGVRDSAAELQQAVGAAAQTGEQQFDRFAQDTISAALQSLHESNEQIIVAFRALHAATVTARANRLAEADPDDMRSVSQAIEQARAQTQAEVERLRKQWDQAAEDVLAACLRHLVEARQSTRLP